MRRKRNMPFSPFDQTERDKQIRSNRTKQKLCSHGLQIMRIVTDSKAVKQDSHAIFVLRRLLSTPKNEPKKDIIVYHNIPNTLVSPPYIFNEKLLANRVKPNGAEKERDRCGSPKMEATGPSGSHWQHDRLDILCRG